MKRIAVHLATGFEETEAITIIDVLRRAGLEVQTVSMTDSTTVTGAHQIPVLADMLFSELDYSRIDVIVLPGGMPGAKNLNEHKGLREQILQFNTEKKLLGAICAAPLVLGHLGILEGKEAVCYPGFEPELHGAKILKDPACVSEHIVTGRGIGVTLTFALKLVEELIDKEKADQLAKAMLVD
ncbi:DJ-1 family glyoxalase III [Sunxiuqinia sp. sy24]|uniref:DJ-1 family glyoxalase III n=1 Tax=Sunxiuqinia sp. sy24 TaxID=3461495 RepID=UPI0040457DCB